MRKLKHPRKRRHKRGSRTKSVHSPSANQAFQCLFIYFTRIDARDDVRKTYKFCASPRGQNTFYSCCTDIFYGRKSKPDSSVLNGKFYIRSIYIWRQQTQFCAPALG